MRKNAIGMLVVEGDQRKLLASGIAAREQVSDAVIAGAGDTSNSARGLFTVEAAGETFSVVAVRAPGATAFVIFEREDSDVLFDFTATVDCADEILRHLLTNPYEAITVVDREGVVRFISPVHERFFGLERGDAVGRHVTEIIENTRLQEVARTGKAEIGQLQEMRGTSRIVSRMPVLDAQGNVLAAIGQIMFKGPDQLRQLSAEVARLRNELTYYRRALSTGVSNRHGLDRIIGQSPAIRLLKDQIARVAPLDVPVLLVGESGTGKELVAHALHLLSKRREQSLVMVNAAAIPGSLVESELFGYEPGAFTGAERKGRRGKFEQAHQGTLFFDEIGDMPIDIQVKLLRVLQDGSFERVGGDKPRISDFRLISASNRDFQAMIDKDDFRLDLFYRISAVTLHLPPLRERLEDIELLVNQALYDFAVKHSMRQKTLAPDVVPFLQAQSWPGNVRQLMHAVDTAAIFADSDVVTIDDFLSVVRSGAKPAPRPATQAAAWVIPPAMPDVAPNNLAAPETANLPPAYPAAPAHATHPTSGLVDEAAHEAPAPKSDTALPIVRNRASVRERISHMEEQLIRDAMQQFGGEKKRVAKELGISRSYLYKRLASMDI